MSKAKVLFSLLALLAVSLAASARPNEEHLATGEEADESFDGLHRIKKSVIDEAYIRPDLSLDGFNQIMIDPVSVAYRRQPLRSSQTRASRSSSNFALTERQMENLKNLFQEAFSDAMSKDEGWKVVDKAGPNVLRVHAELIDLVVRVPTRPSTGRQDFFVREIGEVTLVAELYDSLSGEILARGVDRRLIGPTHGGGLRRATAVTARSDVEILFNAWANLLRTRLDQIRDLTTSQDD